MSMQNLVNGESGLKQISVRSLYLLLTVAAVTFGCAEPVEDISLVQPHYTAKRIFTGEWHY